MLAYEQQYALPLDLLNPADPIEEALTYHRVDQFGFFSILRTTTCIDKDGKLAPVRHQRSYKLSELKDVLETLRGSQDVWISMNEFSRPNRRRGNLAHLTSCYVDLDYYKIQSSAGRSPELIAEQVLHMLDQIHIPKPSLIIDSGRGLQLKWLVEPIPARALPRWNAVQKALTEKLANFGADPKSRDASRVLRLVGTYNSRSGSLVKVVYADTTMHYDFESLADTVLPTSRREIEARRLKEVVLPFDETKRQKTKKNAPKPAGLKQLSVRELWWKRLVDMRTLARIRGWEHGAPEGMQDIALWLSAIALSWSMPSAWLWRELDQLGREFAPSWTPQQRKAVLSTALERLKSAEDGQKMEWNGVLVDPRYKFKNESLIDLLQITPDEERHLCTIISKSEAKRRDAVRHATRRAEAGAVTRSVYEGRSLEREKKAVEMRRQGCTLDAIAGALGVSRRTVYHYLGTYGSRSV